MWVLVYEEYDSMTSLREPDHYTQEVWLFENAEDAAIGDFDDARAKAKRAWSARLARGSSARSDVLYPHSPRLRYEEPLE